MRNKRLQPWAAVLVACLAIASCDDDDENNGTDGAAGADGTAGSGGTAGIDGAAGTGGTSDARDTGGATQTVTVQVVDNRFEPATVTIARGTTVRWTNASATMTHTVTSGASSTTAGAGTLFDRSLAPGATFDYTFNTAGDQPYFCRPHEALGMRGTVRVNP